MVPRDYTLEYEAIIDGFPIKFVIADLVYRVDIEETFIKILSEYPHNLHRRNFKFNVIYGDKKRQIDILVPNQKDSWEIEFLQKKERALTWAGIKSLRLRDIMYLSEKELDEKELVF